MAEIQLGVIEARFADMIWEREPVRGISVEKDYYTHGTQASV